MSGKSVALELWALANHYTAKEGQPVATHQQSAVVISGLSHFALTLVCAPPGKRKYVFVFYRLT